MSQANDLPVQPEAESPDGTPQVVVRAGKTYVCSACGTLVEIPAEFVEQFVLVPPECKKDARPTAASATANASAAKPMQPPASTPSASVASQVAPPRPTTSSTAESSTAKPSRLRLPKRPPRPSFAGQLIDGLRVPQPKQLDRAFAWVSHHLTVLDQKGTEFKQLKKLLKQQKKKLVPCPRPRRPVVKITTPPKSEVKDRPLRSHAHEDVSIMSERIDRGGKQASERGPPTTERSPP